jgi:hypothetical protein
MILAKLPGSCLTGELKLFLKDQKLLMIFGNTKNGGGGGGGRAPQGDKSGSKTRFTIPLLNQGSSLKITQKLNYKISLYLYVNPL